MPQLEGQVHPAPGQEAMASGACHLSSRHLLSSVLLSQFPWQ